MKGTHVGDVPALARLHSVQTLHAAHCRTQLLVHRPLLQNRPQLRRRPPRKFTLLHGAERRLLAEFLRLAGPLALHALALVVLFGFELGVSAGGGLASLGTEGLGEFHELVFGLGVAALLLLLLLLLLFEEGLGWGVEVGAVGVLDVGEVVDGEVEADVPGGVPLLLRRHPLAARLPAPRLLLAGRLLAAGLLGVGGLGDELGVGEQAVELGGRAVLELRSAVLQEQLHVLEPAATEHFLDGHSLVGVEFEDGGDELLESLGEVVAELVAALEHVLLDLGHGVAAEGRVAVDHFVEEHAERPEVDAVIIAGVK